MVEAVDCRTVFEAERTSQASKHRGSLKYLDFYPLLRPHVLAAKEHFDERQVPRGYCFSAGWSAFGGMTRAVQGENWLAVSGIDQVIRIFDDIENSKLRHVDFVEALACMLGCSGGTLNVESPYVARANSIKQRVRYEGVMELDDDAIERQLGEGYFDLQRPIRPRPTRYLDTDIQTSLKRMREIERLYGKLRQNDCGCCGAPTSPEPARLQADGQWQPGSCGERAGRIGGSFRFALHG